MAAECGCPESLRPLHLLGPPSKHECHDHSKCTNTSSEPRKRPRLPTEEDASEAASSAAAISKPRKRPRLTTEEDSSDVLNEAARWEGEVFARLKNALKDKRFVIIIGAGVTLSATADISGRPLSRITWTGLIRNGLDYLVGKGYVDAANRRTKRAKDAESLLDAASIMVSQLNHYSQFPTWLETVFGNLYQEVGHPAILEVLEALH
jgi:hypothetical protein